MRSENLHHSFSSGLGSYAFVFNLLDWPAGVLPVTKVNAQDIADLKDYHTADDIEDFVRKVWV